MQPTVGLALIARDEERTLPRLLASCAGAFDEVVLVDTGSSDGTVACFEAWAATQPQTRCEVAAFTWCDDFSRARQEADDLLRSDWRVWADCDDEIRGAGALRELAAAAAPDVAAFTFPYDYDHRPGSSPQFLLQRERLVRAGAGRWVGRIHEVQEIDGRTVELGADVALWVHHGDSGSEAYLDGTSRMLRDLTILTEQLREDPYDRRAAFYLAQTYQDLGQTEQAIAAYERRAELGGWEEEVFHSRLRAGVLRAESGDWPAGFAALVSAWESRPTRIEPLYELAWRLRVRGEPHTALLFAQRGLHLRPPTDRLFVQRWIHDWGMLFEFSVVAYWAGEFDAGLEACERLLTNPGLPDERRTETLANRGFCRERIRQRTKLTAAQASGRAP